MDQYLSFLAFFLAISGFVIVALFLNAILGPKPKKTAAKQMPFECGAVPIENDNTRKIPIKFYAIAVLFILFDLEGVFLYLWAMAATTMTTFMFSAFAIFMFFLIWIYIYIWREKTLDFLTEKK
jgi:NADH-quinone oxidoreductase subunit A